MMERILLGVLFLSGWTICPTHLLRQYHYIPQTMTWTEAQTYCRQNYSDLATIENREELNQMNQILSSAGSNSEVWIGLYSLINWQWSDGYTGSGADYRHWYNTEPSCHNGNEYCVVSFNGDWYDYWCSSTKPFICNNGTLQDPEFVLVTQPKTWSDAQAYCRQHFFDLATVRNETENLKINSLSPNDSSIGLFRTPSTLWSDGSGFSFTNWLQGPNPTPLTEGKVCGASSGGTWRLNACDSRFPFVCHGDPSPPAVQKQLLKLRLMVDDSSVDLNDPIVKANILKKLQERLREGGVDGVNLKWKEQHDGKVFHKESEGFEEKPKKKKSRERKTEL